MPLPNGAGGELSWAGDTDQVDGAEIGANLPCSAGTHLSRSIEKRWPRTPGQQEKPAHTPGTQQPPISLRIHSTTSPWRPLPERRKARKSKSFISAWCDSSRRAPFGSWADPDETAPLHHGGVPPGDDTPIPWTPETRISCLGQDIKQAAPIRPQGLSPRPAGGGRSDQSGGPDPSWGQTGQSRSTRPAAKASLSIGSTSRPWSMSWPITTWIREPRKTMASRVGSP